MLHLLKIQCLHNLALLIVNFAFYFPAPESPVAAALAGFVHLLRVFLLVAHRVRLPVGSPHLLANVRRLILQSHQGKRKVKLL